MFGIFRSLPGSQTVDYNGPLKVAPFYLICLTARLVIVRRVKVNRYPTFKKIPKLISTQDRELTVTEHAVPIMIM